MVGTRPTGASDLSALRGDLIEHAEVAVVVTDPVGAITHWNPFAESLFGWTKEEALGRRARDLLIREADLPKARELEAELAQGRRWEGEFVLLRNDGGTVLCRVRSSPIPGGEGDVIGMLAVVVDISDQKRLERRLEARTAVTTVLAEEATLAEATPRILASVCRALGWQVGAMWQVDGAADILRCVDVWSAAPSATEEFERIARSRTFRRGDLLPGRVWELVEPLWFEDVTTDPRFSRAEAARMADLHGAFAFPIVLGADVLGVLEFFSTQIEEPDEQLLQTMTVIGSQIGQFIERLEAERALRVSHEQLEAIFQSVDDGITVLAPDGRLLYANDAAARLIGFPSVDELLAASPDEVMGRFEIMDEYGQALPVEELPGRRALQGEHPPETVVRFRTVGEGEERWSIVRGTPVFADDGRVEFAINVFHDITERQRADAARRFLAEASDVLAASLDYEETLRRVARLAVPRLADWCAIDIREEDGSVRQVAVEHVDPAKVEFVRELGERYPPDPDAPTGPRNVLRTGLPELYPEIPTELLEAAAVDEEHLQIIRSLGLRSAMVVPLLARGRTLGAITFVSAESRRRYAEEDLTLAQELARRAALAVDNARLFRERSHVAEVLQRSLLPPALPRVPGIELASRYRPAGEGLEVGGDFYDVFPCTGGTWALLIGDVCGKGPDAAAVTGLARYTIRTAAGQDLEPAQVLTALNGAVVQQRSDHLFCTVAYTRLRPRAGGGASLTVCCGGHPLPLVLRADGSVEAIGQPGTLIGIFADPELRESNLELEPGDALVLYTDGVIEEHSSDSIFGRDRLEDLLRGCAGMDAEEIAATIERAVVGFRPDPPRDDIAVLVAKAVG